MNSKHPDTDRHSNDLTQLSSREQLSALMDGALPADQTRFLLRRLQHDESLAASWERWRIAGEAMRGLAPTQRLPADFARRVSASLHGDAGLQELAPVATVGRPGWLRWAGGAAVAASVAVVALLAMPPGDVREGAATPQLAAASAIEPAAPSLAAAEAPLPRPARSAETPAAVTAATVAVAVAARPPRPERSAQAGATRRSPAPAAAGEVPAVASVLAANPIVTRPWPRAVLPQYAQGGLAVGFGDGDAAVANPFQQPQLAMVPVFEPPASDRDSEVRAVSASDAGNEPAPETEPR